MWVGPTQTEVETARPRLPWLSLLSPERCQGFPSAQENLSEALGLRSLVLAQALPLTFCVTLSKAQSPSGPQDLSRKEPVDLSLGDSGCAKLTLLLPVTLPGLMEK